MTNPDRQKETVLFVHGFGSSARCWERMLELLRADERLASRYDFSTWEYRTSWLSLDPRERIPRLHEIAAGLATEIESLRYLGRKLTLVGHSQGGLVIQTYLARKVGASEGWKLRGVRQVIFFATPTEGSNLGMGLRRLLSTLFTNPQELTLRVFSPEVADIRRTVYEQVVRAKQDTNGSWRIPIHVFCAMEDNVVPEASARGSFASVKTVKGNHSTVIRPDDRDDARYRELAELLLDPGGHPCRFEIESYETNLRVEPREPSTITGPGGPVRYDNFATMARTVRFAAANRCHEPFTIHYGTRRSGLVIGRASHENEAPKSQLGIGEDYGTYFRFDFTPRDPLQEYRLTVEIYAGYDPGHRDVHFHLGPHSFYRRLSYVLDLSAYLAAGYSVSRKPTFFFDPADPGHGEMCAKRGGRSPIEPTESAPGVYRWELTDVQEGVVDLVWDVEPAIPLAATGAAAGASAE